MHDALDAVMDATSHVTHEFKPGQSTSRWNPNTHKNEPHENPNFCKVCGRKKDSVLHTAQTKDVLPTTDRREESKQQWTARLLKQWPTAYVKGPSAWVQKKNGRLLNVGNYDEYLERGEVDSK